ncbi:MAG: carboxylating nicotinate-nucleotide diphosphorylase [Candidatus Omnitrophica bacterium]|nr:carboxylating nicotinate-nucleotide diphosphorylase [Candidatus Omnitrophota bacterium]
MRTIETIIAIALREDISQGDITTNYLIPKDHYSEAVILVKEDAFVCGIDIARKVFHAFDETVKFEAVFKDGDHVPSGSALARLRGKTRSLLTCERVALNFLGYLSGIATNTNRFAQKIKPYPVEILDTRKTTPGLRILEKYAVRCGGGVNHRMNLNEMALIKDNHRDACHPEMTITQSIARIRRRTERGIEVEVDNLDQFREALTAGPDMILLDNMSVVDMRLAVRLARKKFKDAPRPLLEASGGITLKNIRSVAATGVDRISVGSLTHTLKNIDISMEIFNK